MHMIGFIIAAIIQVFSDKYGRKMGMGVFLFGAGSMFLLNGLFASKSYVLFGIIQMMLVAFANGSCLAFTVYGIEIIGPKYRSTAGVLAHCYFALGFMLLTPIAMIVDNVASFMFIGVIISLVALAVLPFVPPSFRWQLAAGGRTDEGVATLAKFTKKCGASLDVDTVTSLAIKQDEVKSAVKQDIRDLVKSPVMMRLSAKLSFLWVVTSLSYYKLAIGEKSGNLMIDNIWSGVTEVVFLVLGSFCIQLRWAHRRWLLCGLFLITACSLAMNCVLETFNQPEPAQLACLPGRGASVVLFAVIFVYTAEIYPTTVRSSGLGFCSFWGRIGGVFAPQVDRLALFGVWVPGSAVTVLLIAACLTS